MISMTRPVSVKLLPILSQVANKLFQRNRAKVRQLLHPATLGAWRVHGPPSQTRNFAGLGALAGRGRGAGNAQTRHKYSGFAGSGIVLNLTWFSGGEQGIRTLGTF